MYMITLYIPQNYYEVKYFISLFAHFKHKAKYIITMRIPTLFIKKFMITTYMLKS